MNFRDHSPKQKLSKLAEDNSDQPATRSRISRRALLRYGSTTAIVTGGLAGLIELLGPREAIAAGTVIPIAGITREPDEDEEIPHRHTFSVRFVVTSVSPSAIIGDVSGRTERVISTGDEDEEQHFHEIEATDVDLETLILSGPENNEAGEHSHIVSIE